MPVGGDNMEIRGTLDNPSESPTYGNNATTTV